MATKKTATPAKHLTYRNKMIDQGFHLVTVWAPDPDQIKKYAEKKRKAHLK